MSAMRCRVRRVQAETYKWARRLPARVAWNDPRRDTLASACWYGRRGIHAIDADTVLLEFIGKHVHQMA